MQLGVFARIFARSSVQEVFEVVASHGLRCVQFNLACAGLPTLPDEIEIGTMEGIRDAAAARGIAIAAVSGTFNLIHPDPAQRSQGLSRLRVLIAACPHLGTNIITLCTGTRDPDDMWRWHSDNTSPEAWRDLTTSVGELVEIAGQLGVTLGLEPEPSNVIDTAQKARQLLDEISSPNLKIILDAANLFHPGEVPRMKEILDEAFDLLGGDIVLAHAKELGRDGRAGDLTLGTGVLDWGYYLALLRKVNFTGAVIMHGIQEKDVRASGTFLHAKLAQAGAASEDG